MDMHIDRYQSLLLLVRSSVLKDTLDKVTFSWSRACALFNRFIETHDGKFSLKTNIMEYFNQKLQRVDVPLTGNFINLWVFESFYFFLSNMITTFFLCYVRLHGLYSILSILLLCLYESISVTAARRGSKE